MRKAVLFFIVSVVLPTFVILTQGFHSDRERFEEEFLEKYQIVHPKLHALNQGRRRRSVDSLSTVYENGHLEDISVSIEGFERPFILQLSRNRLLLPEGSRASFYSSNGILINRPFESIDNCYYQGFIEGLENSSVALSTCEGIEGLIFDGKERFYIQPSDEIKNETHIHPHIIFKMKDLKLPKVLCGQQDDQEMFKLLKLHDKKSSRTRRSIDSETKYLELVMVNDKLQYEYYKENTTKRSLKIANIVDLLFRPLNLRVALIELIIWKDKDEIQVVTGSSTTLSNFVKWRNDVLIKEKKLKHDNIQLLTHIDFDGQTVGKAHVLAICTSRSVGVVQDHSSNAAATAATLAHEMGHNLGLSHDDKDSCDCASAAANTGQACIMSGVARHKPATEWSSCSLKEFKMMLDKGLDSCLFNYPAKFFGGPICGNGFKEKGEECDCGRNYTECEMYTDNCCDPKTCKLLPHADCDDGPCCEKCKFKSAGSVCRKKVTECDLPESCSGSSSLCPSNKYVHHGRSCAGGKGYCYRGICPTHKSQCQTLWGDEAKPGPELCFLTNMKGNYLGSCRAEGGVNFTACKKKDIYCGMLHCANSKTDLPIIGTERQAYKYKYPTEDGTVECWSASIDAGNDVPDPGMAKEGTKCAEDKICVGQECVDITQVFLSNPKCPGDCSPNGICNNEGDCFCDDCWGGSDCSKSVTCKHGSPAAGQSKLAGYVMLVFLCIALVAGGVLAFIFRDQLKTKLQERKQERERRYRCVDDKSSTNRTTSGHSTDGKLPSVTMAPKPPPPAPPSRPGTSRQPGKIELPSWPTENKSDDETVTPFPRRQPPGIPPTGSYGYKPSAGPRPGSYAGVLDTKPLNKPPPRPSPLLGREQSTSDRPLLPSEIKKSQELNTPGSDNRSVLPQRPARMPPLPPGKPPLPRLPPKV